MSRLHHRTLGLLVAASSIGLALTAFRSGVVAQAVPATVVTDKAGYLAGESVAITGSGFMPGEVVALQVTHVLAETEQDARHEPFAATADEAGTFSVGWPIAEDPAGVSFVLSTTRVAAEGVPAPVEPVPFRRIAIVQTDKYDYQPGEVASIAGAGFRAGEVVSLRVEHTNGFNDGAGHDAFEVVASDDGRVAAAWLVDPADSEGAIFRLTAVGTASGIVATSTFTDLLVTLVDDQGPDDEPGQKDLSFLQIDYSPMTPDLAVAWGWDDTRWSGNNTGDACTLFDTDADGFANYSICITVDQSGSYLATRLYSCGADSRTDRCGGPASVPTFASAGSASVVVNADPFKGIASHGSGNKCSDGPGCVTNDTVANLTVKLADFGGSTAKLLNVCSYPSQEPNSDPSDCVVTPNSGFLTLVKVATPDVGTPFTFTSSAASQSGITSWTINGSGSVQLISFAAGTYDLSEAIPSGWKLESASCVIQTAPPTNTGTGAAPPAVAGPASAGVTGFAIQQGLETICTFTDAKQAGSITIVKHTVGGDGTFSFTPTGFGSGPFDLTTVGNTASQTFGTLAPGSGYSISETPVPSGWDLTDMTCSNGTPAAITVVDGQTTTCTFTNTGFQVSRGRIIVDKVTNPSGDPTSFSFALSDTAVTIAAFGLTDAATPYESDYLVPGTYAVSETVPTGWTLSAACDGAAYANGGTLTVVAGQDIHCTFTNTKDATLTLVKNVVNDNGGTAAVGDFTLKADTTVFTSGTSEVVAPATYSLSETGPSGYTAGAWACAGFTNGGSQSASQVTVNAGEAVTCAITNDDQPPSLTLVKAVTNDNGGTAVASDFTLTATGPTSISGPGGASSDASFGKGTYVLSETTLAGYTASVWSCVGGTQVGANITLDLGQSATCTITNDDQPPSLTLVKAVTNDNGGTAVASDFTLTATGPTSISGPGGASSDASFGKGTYVLSETTLAGYTASGWVCDGGTQVGANITLDLGQSATCTITNDDQQAYLTLTKTVVNDNGGTAVADDFARFIDGSPVSWSLAVPVAPGSHTASETTLPGYSASAWGGDCSANGTVSLALGESKTCSITNDDIAPTLMLVKTVVNDHGGTRVADDFARSIDGTPVAWGTAVTLNAGPHTASETALPGYAASAWGGDCAADGTVTLAVGDARTCTITNDDIAPTLTLIKTVVNDNGGTKLVSDFPLFINGSAVTSGVASTFAANLLLTATETSQTGYAASTWGGDCAADGTITLLPGDNKTCTITNDDIAPTLTLVKTVVNSHGGTATGASWTLTASGPTGFSGAGPTVTNGASFDAGSYTLSESGPSGYAASAWSCSGGTLSGDQVTVELGQSATCRIINADIQPTLTLVKLVVNDNGGTKTVADFPLFISGALVTSGVPVGVSAGTYSASEMSQYGYTASAWGGDCAANGAVSLSVGQNKTCTITNNDQPGTIVVIKNAKPANGSFAFAVTGAGYGAFTLNGDTTGGGNRNSQTLNAGSYTVTESTQLGWILTGLGGATDPATPYNCVVTGSGGSTGVGNLATQTASIILKNGDTVTCTFENTGQGVTRTQGFWATHPQLATLAWTGGSAFGNTFPGVPSIPGIGDNLVCGRPLDTTMLPLQNEVMGTFWSDISRTSTGVKRAALDQARMQLLQQLIAAELNAGAFGSVPSGGIGMFAAWESALCGTNSNAIKSAQQQAAAFNTNGDSGTFTPGTSADSKNARDVANTPFWNIIKP